MSLHDYLGIKFWFEVSAIIISIAMSIVFLIWSWWHDR